MILVAVAWLIVPCIAHAYRYREMVRQIEAAEREEILRIHNGV